jgi:cytosine/uracil/thiamine/allantoin permease
MSRVLRAFAVATIVLALALAAFGLWLISSASTQRLLPVVSTDASAHSVIVSQMIVTASWMDTIFPDFPRNSQLPPSQSGSPTPAPPVAARPLFLILDSLPAHKAKVVDDYRR